MFKGGNVKYVKYVQSQLKTNKYNRKIRDFRKKEVRKGERIGEEKGRSINADSGESTQQLVELLKSGKLLPCGDCLKAPAAIISCEMY